MITKPNISLLAFINQCHRRSTTIAKNLTKTVRDFMKFDPEIEEVFRKVDEVLQILGELDQKHAQLFSKVVHVFAELDEVLCQFVKLTDPFL